MNLALWFQGHARRKIAGACAAVLLICTGWYIEASAQDKTDFPDGYDAVQAAPHSHKVIFENALVRVLEVTVPPAGQTEPMHHHRWPGFFIDWDTGGRSPHIRYHRADGSVTDSPSNSEPVHAGRWSVQWMKPEPLHAIEVIENYHDPKAPPLIRVEIKVPRFAGAT